MVPIDSMSGVEQESEWVRLVWQIQEYEFAAEIMVNQINIKAEVHIWKQFERITRLYLLVVLLLVVQHLKTMIVYYESTEMTDW